jgi:hypothetical protein
VKMLYRDTGSVQLSDGSEHLNPGWSSGRGPYPLNIDI